MHYSVLNPFDFSNGEGCRVTLFCSGCSHRCKGCWSKKTWNPHFGEEYTEETEEAILSHLGDKRVSGLSLLGGDPLHSKNRETMQRLCERVREAFPNKTIWLWTGYTKEQMEEDNTLSPFLSLCDIIIDGRFEESLRNLTLAHRGSSNQRILVKNIDF